METTSDKAFAVAGSVGLHVFVFLVLYWGLLRQPELMVAASDGPAIEATLVSSPQQSAAAVRRMEAAKPQADTNAAPPPQPTPEPKPQDAPQPAQPVPQAQLPKPDTVDQDEIRRAAELAAKEKGSARAGREAPAGPDRPEPPAGTGRRRESPAPGAAATREGKANRRYSKAACGRQSSGQAAGAEIQAACRRLKNGITVADAARGDRVVRTGYACGRKHAARNEPHRSVQECDQGGRAPELAPAGCASRKHCITHYKQYIGGEVYEVTFGDCPLDAVAQQSIRDALQRTPLPYSGFESAFLKEGTIDMCSPDDACK